MGVEAGTEVKKAQVLPGLQSCGRSCGGRPQMSAKMPGLQREQRCVQRLGMPSLLMLKTHFCRQLVAVPEERFHELVAAEVSFLATVPVQPVSMQQAHSRCKRKQSAICRWWLVGSADW